MRYVTKIPAKRKTLQKKAPPVESGAPSVLIPIRLLHLTMTLQVLPIAVDLLLYPGDEVVRQMAEPALTLNVFTDRPQRFRAVGDPVSSILNLVQRENARPDG